MLKENYGDVSPDLGVYSEGAVLHHVALVLQQRYSITSHRLGVTAKVQCYITWS